MVKKIFVKNNVKSKKRVKLLFLSIERVIWLLLGFCRAIYGFKKVDDYAIAETRLVFDCC